MKKTVSGIELEIVQGDITRQPDLEAIVNAANSSLRGGGGVDGAIHRAAGPELKRESSALAPIYAGDAVITRGYGLPNRYVIHCVGPVYGVDQPGDRLLADCYRKALVMADEQMIGSVGFPAISTGVFGYPMRKAAEVMFKTMADMIPNLKRVKKIRIILFDKNAYQIHQEEFACVFGPD